MSKIKKEYHRTIEPHMNVVAESCRSFGIPMFSTFQVAPQNFITFCLNEERSNWAKLKMMSYMDDTWSVDEFLDKLITDALENGHDSIYLEAMGVPKRPDEIKAYNNKINHLKALLKMTIDKD
jgi:hypothetical protein